MLGGGSGYRHARHTVLQQRQYQITAGYVDQNDADALRQIRS
jgi:hypothetical protein